MKPTGEIRTYGEGENPDYIDSSIGRILIFYGDNKMSIGEATQKIHALIDEKIFDAGHKKGWEEAQDYFLHNPEDLNPQPFKEGGIKQKGTIDGFVPDNSEILISKNPTTI